MGVKVLSPENTSNIHTRHLRSLPRIPNFHNSMKPLNTVKHPRALPAVPNSKVDPIAKVAPRALPRVPKPPNMRKDPNLPNRHGRVLPEVPFKERNNSSLNNSNSKDENTSGSSRTSTPHHHHHNHDVHHNNHNHDAHHHEGGRKLPKIPKLSMLQKQKPEQNRIEYMHDVYRKEGDIFSEDGNYEQALKSYNLALRFISDNANTIIARSRVYRKLGKLRKAMQDAELALQLDPLYHEALLQKAELLLEQGDYENALKFFQNGARMRPDKEDFHDGIQKAKIGISEHHKQDHKGTRKRKNTKSPEENGTDRKKVNEPMREKSNNLGSAQISMKQKQARSLNFGFKKKRNCTIRVAKTKAKDKVKKNHDNVNVQVRSANSHKQEHKDPVKHDPPQHVPVPPAAPAPAAPRGRMNGRQMTPMPGKMKMRQHPLRRERLEEQPMETETPQPPREEDVDNEMMKSILGQMYKDKDYLEKLLNENDISLPNASNLAPSAENGLHFLYDRVLNWVRQGELTQPSVQPTPVPRETKTSARRKAMAHHSSVESIVEEVEKENEIRKKRTRKKKEPKAPNSWYNYLENKKAEEAHERKQFKNVFLHVVEGHKINPREHSNLEIKKSKAGPEHSRRKDGKLRREKEHESKESLSQPFIFRSYRPGSDMRNSKDSKGTPHTSSEHEELITRTPPKIHKLTKKEKRQQEIERRRAAVAKFVAKEMEDIELSYAENKYIECTDKANHVIDILEREDWPEKYVTIATLYSFIGNACIGRKDYEGGLKYHHLDLEIGEKHKIDDAVSRALGNLGRIYVVQKRHQEALDVFLKKTPMCASRIETAWLFHEIGNCFLALGDFEYAKDAAKKSLEAAEEAVEWSYQLQSCVLMGVAEVKLKQYHAAFNTFEKALDQARLQGDEKAEDAIRDALQDVNDRIVEEMRTKGPMNFPADARSDAFLTPISRDNSSLAGYQYQGLSRSRAEIARMQAELGFRCRADYAKTPAAVSDYSSIIIPDDDGSMSLTETEYDGLQLDLERMRTTSTIFGSSLDLRDNIRAESFVSGKGKLN